ncbi:DUF2835 family protein [Ectothiorhodospiraceae bacterium BW-2]|nr:DUF2835 family protein [Ectothiorhodospiraceae bacterium BW-2]
MNSAIYFNLSIDKDEMVKYYTGVRTVLAHSLDGRKVEFPANRLQPFIGHDGVHGLFRLVFDQNHKFVALERVDLRQQ